MGWKELEEVVKKFGFEKGKCKKGLIKVEENDLEAYNFKSKNFQVYSTKEPIAVEYMDSLGTSSVLVPLGPYIFAVKKMESCKYEEPELRVYWAYPRLSGIDDVLKYCCFVAYKDETYIKPEYCKKCKLEKK